MPNTPYIYPIVDFGSALIPPSEKVNIDRLVLEIQQSAIVIALDNVTVVAPNCTITFKDPLSLTDVAILDDIVAYHNGEPLPNDIPQPVQLYSGVGEKAPLADGTPVMLPNLFPPGVILNFAGAGDDVVLGRGNGPEFKLVGPANGADVVQEFQFNDWVVFGGGGLAYKGALFGDNVDMQLYAPASIALPTPGVGNCNLVDPGTGFAVLVVPAPGNGSHTVDLATAVPVPSPTGIGYYEWSFPDTGLGAVTEGVPGQSAYNLFVVVMQLSRFVTKMQMIDDRTVNLTIPAVKPMKVLPQWKGKVTLRTASQSQAKLTWYIVTARMRTI